MLLKQYRTIEQIMCSDMHSITLKNYNAVLTAELRYRDHQ